MKLTPKADLSEAEYRPYSQGDGSVTLATIKLLTLREGLYFDIKPSVKWQGATYCQIIALRGEYALCKVAKVDKRRAYGGVNWLDGEHAVPFTKFVAGPH